MQARHRSRPGLAEPAPCPYPRGPGGLVQPPRDDRPSMRIGNNVAPHSAPTHPRRTNPRLAPLGGGVEPDLTLTATAAPPPLADRRYLPSGPVLMVPRAGGSFQHSTSLATNTKGVTSSPVKGAAMVRQQSVEDMQPQGSSPGVANLSSSNPTLLTVARDVIDHPQDDIDENIISTLEFRGTPSAREAIFAVWSAALGLSAPQHNAPSAPVVQPSAELRSLPSQPTFGVLVAARFATPAVLASVGALAQAAGATVIEVSRQHLVCAIPADETKPAALSDAVVAAYEVAEIFAEDDRCLGVAVTHGAIQWTVCMSHFAVPHGKAVEGGLAAAATTQPTTDAPGIRIAMTSSTATLLGSRGVVVFCDSGKKKKQTSPSPPQQDDVLFVDCFEPQGDRSDPRH